MEFTENQHQPFKRMSQLSIVAVMHIAVLAVVLNDMKIRITPHNDGPLILTEVEKEKPVEPEMPKEFKPELKVPLDPVFIPKNEVAETKPSTAPVIARVTDSNEGKFNQGAMDRSGSDEGSTIAPPQARTPHHVAAVIDVNACDKPVYPASALRNGETGTVSLSMLVGTDGRVVQTRMDASSGSRALDRAASEALSLCRFKPGTIDGVPQQSWTKVQYVWKMD